jgi:hypothetical protein
MKIHKTVNNVFYNMFYLTGMVLFALFVGAGSVGVAASYAKDVPGGVVGALKYVAGFGYNFGLHACQITGFCKEATIGDAATDAVNSLAWLTGVDPNCHSKACIRAREHLRLQALKEATEEKERATKAAEAAERALHDQEQEEAEEAPTVTTTPKATPKASPKATPKATPKAAPKATPRPAPTKPAAPKVAPPSTPKPPPLPFFEEEPESDPQDEQAEAVGEDETSGFDSSNL